MTNYIKLKNGNMNGFTCLNKFLPKCTIFPTALLLYARDILFMTNFQPYKIIHVTNVAMCIISRGVKFSLINILKGQLTQNVWGTANAEHILYRIYHGKRNCILVIFVREIHK